jgi:putative ABC transport system ATP-binding protein
MQTSQQTVQPDLAGEPAAIPKKFYKFLLGIRPNLQAAAVLLAMLSIPLTYAILHIPKIVIDDGIKGEGFPREILGITVHQLSFLVAICLAFLLLNALSGFLKLKLNILVGYISEVGLRDLRLAVLKLLRGEASQTIPSSQKVEIVIPEMEAFGGFIGDCLSIPVAQFSIMGTIVYFMFEQNVLLGAASIAIIPIQATIVPILQRRVLRIRKTRINLVRRFSATIERLDERAAKDMFANRKSPETIYRIYSDNILKNRMMLFRAKYNLKFANNMLGKVTPFLFYLVGGILVIQNEITLGSLMAALVAYQQLDEPWRVLVQFFQRLRTTKMQYEQIVAKVT